MDPDDHHGPASGDGFGDALRRTLVGSLDYLHARLALLRYEAKEAGTDLVLRLAGFLVAALFACLAYIVALGGTIGWIAAAGDWAWYKVALIAALLHLLAAAGLVLFAKRKFGKAPFRDTLAEMQRDRQWLEELRDDEKGS